MTTQTIPDQLSAIMAADHELERARQGVADLQPHERIALKDYFNKLWKLCAEAEEEL